MNPDPKTLTSPSLTALRAARGAGKRRRSQQADPTSVIAYTRVSTEEQAISGLGLAAQADAIQAEAARRGWTIVDTFTDEGVSGKVPPDNRPGLASAIAALDDRKAALLVVAKVDRLGRSFRDLALLTPIAERFGWGIVALDSPLDASTPTGAAMVRLMSVFAALEADLISQRTRSALAVKSGQGHQLGTPTMVPTSVRRRIGRMRARGMSWRQVAADLNAKGVPSGSGKAQWQPATARRLALPQPS